MVMAGVLIEESNLVRLKSIGVKDSKLLTREKRDELFEKIKELADKAEIIIISPKEIDDAVQSSELNLNWLEAHKSAEIINKLKPDKTTIDSPSNNCKAYAVYLTNLLDNKNMQLECVHKADVKYIHVGAASILAKVVRDREIDKLQKKYGNCGPGYTSNEITQKFLKENWEKYPEIFRHSWISYQNHKMAKSQKTLFEHLK